MRFATPSAAEEVGGIKQGTGVGISSRPLNQVPPEPVLLGAGKGRPGEESSVSGWSRPAGGQATPRWRQIAATCSDAIGPAAAAEKAQHHQLRAADDVLDIGAFIRKAVAESCSRLARRRRCGRSRPGWSRLQAGPTRPASAARQASSVSAADKAR